MGFTRGWGTTILYQPVKPVLPNPTQWSDQWILIVGMKNTVVSPPSGGAQPNISARFSNPTRWSDLEKQELEIKLAKKVVAPPSGGAQPT